MTKDEYKIYAEDLIKDISNRIDELRQRANGVDDKIRAEFNEKVLHLVEMRNDLNTQLEAFENVEESRWEEVKNEFSKGIEFLKQNFQKLFSILSR